MSKYTVWVGGGEYNSRYLTLEQAEALSYYLRYGLGYRDVSLECVND
jgi:transposase-like protein